MLKEMEREVQKAGSRVGSALEPQAFQGQGIWAEWGGLCGLEVRVTVTSIGTAQTPEELGET